MTDEDIARKIAGTTPIPKHIRDLLAIQDWHLVQDFAETVAIAAIHEAKGEDTARLDWLDEQDGAIRSEAYGEYKFYFEPETKIHGYGFPKARDVINAARIAEEL